MVWGNLSSGPLVRQLSCFTTYCDNHKGNPWSPRLDPFTQWKYALDRNQEILIPGVSTAPSPLEYGKRNNIVNSRMVFLK